MIKVYLLLILVQTSDHVDSDAIVFETEARCVKNVENVKAQLKKSDNIVYAQCFEREINK